MVGNLREILWRWSRDGLKFHHKFARDNKGATAIEYGMIAALIAVGMLTALTELGQSVSDTYDYILAQYIVANS